MNMKNTISIITYVISGAKVCWFKDTDKNKVSVMAMLPKDACQLTGIQSMRLADRAKKIAINKAKKVGEVISTDVFMGKGDDSGSVMATGIANMHWNPEIERRLYASGIRQLAET